MAIVCMFGLVAIWLLLQNKRQMDEFEQKQLNYRAELKAGVPPQDNTSGGQDGLGGLMQFLPLLQDPNVQTLLANLVSKKEN